MLCFVAPHLRSPIIVTIMLKTFRLHIYNILGVITMLSFGSCGDMIREHLETPEALEEAEHEAVSAHLNHIINSQMYLTADNYNQKTVQSSGCFTISFNREARQIILDFGDGCESANGVRRAGKLFLNFTGPYFRPGSTIIVSFDNFFINEVRVQGSRKVTNITEAINEAPTFLVEAALNFNWPDGSISSRNVFRLETYIVGMNPDLFEYWIYDAHSAEPGIIGIDRNGVEYSVVIQSPLVVANECLSSAGMIPVEGIARLYTERRDYEFDFGDGLCNRNVIVRYGNNSSKTLTL